MTSFRAAAIAIVSCVFLLTTASIAQSPVVGKTSRTASEQMQALRARGPQRVTAPRSKGQRFLASDEGRAFLKATGHPLAQYAIDAFGEPSEDTAIPPHWLRQAASAEAAVVPASVPCTGNNGARFNLEPRANATPQSEATADFLPNRAGVADDLIVQGANDWRGNLTSAKWDGNVSGYYVHRSTTADCSTQFEGGLPTITVQGGAQFGIGGTVVAADPERDAIFMADQRFGSLSGVGLFRASATTLLDSNACPSGTHTSAQAASCWTVTPPAFVFSQPSPDLGGAQPVIAVDERATSAGTGAGDVYVVGTAPNAANGGNASIFLAACTNTLNCGGGAGVAVSGSDLSPDFPYARVRTDGTITVSYVNANSDGTLDIKFLACKPEGAPKAPVCSAAALVQHVSEPIAVDLVNISLIDFTYPKLTSRAEAGGKFTAFLVYDDCKSPFSSGNPPMTVCLGAEVLMTASTDNGKTWSAPVSVDTAVGHHFYPAITTDPATGVVHIAYYSTEGDKFNHAVRVVRNQINPGGTTVGAAQAVTKLPDPIDGDPDFLASIQFDLFMGAVARGTGLTGHSRLYLSFDSTTVPGTYEGLPDAELNNHIIQVTF